MTMVPMSIKYQRENTKQSSVVYGASIQMKCTGYAIQKTFSQGMCSVVLR